MAQWRSGGVASAFGITGREHGAHRRGRTRTLRLSRDDGVGLHHDRLTGGGYLIFFGIRMIMTRPQQFQVRPNLQRATVAAAFRQGVLTNILNPKVALFFLAFLPQFIDPVSPHKVVAFVVLGLTFVTTGTIWCLVLAWCAGIFSERLRRNRAISEWLNRAVGHFLFSSAYVWRRRVRRTCRAIIRQRRRG